MAKEGSLDEALRVTIYAIVFLFGIFLFKLVVGMATGSIALVADAFNSLSDTTMIVVLYFALRLLKKKPDERFHYGYYRLEDLLSLLMSIMFFAVAFQIMWDGISALFGAYEGSHSYEFAIIAELIVAGALLIFSRKLYRAARNANITSLALSARDMRIDTVSAVLVAVSVYVNKVLSIPFEGFAAVIIGILIITNAYRGAKTAILNLLDAWDRPEIVNQIRKIFDEVGMLKLGELRLRRSGPIIFGEATVYAPEEMRIEDVDELLERIETEIYRRIPDIKEIVWEVEPFPENKMICAVPISGGKIADWFEEAEKYVLYELDLSKKDFRLIGEVPNKFGNKGSKSVRICKALIDKGTECVIVKNIDYITYSIFDAYGVEIYRILDGDIETALKLIAEEKIEPLKDFPENINPPNATKYANPYDYAYGALTIDANLAMNGKGNKFGIFNNSSSSEIHSIKAENTSDNKEIEELDEEHSNSIDLFDHNK